ncbi:hypothetical protein ACFRH9_08510 [Peribacillus butanolivorans]|uniref:hypothetical protein n=1 Tax=Peribacillus butanolivorans TaxID=421767 RepID=UPI00366A7370
MKNFISDSISNRRVYKIQVAFCLLSQAFSPHLTCYMVGLKQALEERRKESQPVQRKKLRVSASVSK